MSNLHPLLGVRASGVSSQNVAAASGNGNTRVTGVSARPLLVPLTNVTQPNFSQPRAGYVVPVVIGADGRLSSAVMFGFINERNAARDPLQAPNRPLPSSQQIRRMSLDNLYDICRDDPNAIIHFNSEQMIAYLESIAKESKRCDTANTLYSDKLRFLHRFVEDIISPNLALSAQILLEKYVTYSNFQTRTVADGLSAVRDVMRAIRALRPLPVSINVCAFHPEQLALFGSSELRVINPLDIQHLDHYQVMALSLAMHELGMDLQNNPGLSRDAEAKHEIVVAMLRERVHGVLQYVHDAAVAPYIERAGVLINQTDALIFPSQDLPINTRTPVISPQVQSVNPYYFAQRGFERATEEEIQRLDLDFILAMSDEDKLKWFSSVVPDAILNCNQPSKIWYWMQNMKYLHHKSPSASRFHVAIEQQMAWIRYGWLNSMVHLAPDFAHSAPDFATYLDSIFLVGQSRLQIGSNNLISLKNVQNHQIQHMSTVDLLRCDLREIADLSTSTISTFSHAMWAKIYQNKAGLSNVKSAEFKLYQRLCFIQQHWAIQHFSYLNAPDAEESEAITFLDTLIKDCASSLPQVKEQSTVDVARSHLLSLPFDMMNLEQLLSLRADMLGLERLASTQEADAVAKYIDRLASLVLSVSKNEAEQISRLGAELSSRYTHSSIVQAPNVSVASARKAFLHLELFIKLVQVKGITSTFTSVDEINWLFSTLRRMTILLPRLDLSQEEITALNQFSLLQRIRLVKSDTCNLPPRSKQNLNALLDDFLAAVPRVSDITPPTTMPDLPNEIPDLPDEVSRLSDLALSDSKLDDLGQGDSKLSEQSSVTSELSSVQAEDAEDAIVIPPPDYLASLDALPLPAAAYDLTIAHRARGHWYLNNLTPDRLKEFGFNDLVRVRLAPISSKETFNIVLSYIDALTEVDNAYASSEDVERLMLAARRLRLHTFFDNPGLIIDGKNVTALKAEINTKLTAFELKLSAKLEPPTLTRKQLIAEDISQASAADMMLRVGALGNMGYLADANEKSVLLAHIKRLVEVMPQMSAYNFSSLRSLAARLYENYISLLMFSHNEQADFNKIFRNQLDALELSIESAYLNQLYLDESQGVLSTPDEADNLVKRLKIMASIWARNKIPENLRSDLVPLVNSVNAQYLQGDKGGNVLTSEAKQQILYYLHVLASPTGSHAELVFPLSSQRLFSEMEKSQIETTLPLLELANIIFDEKIQHDQQRQKIMALIEALRVKIRPLNIKVNLDTLEMVQDLVTRLEHEIEFKELLVGKTGAANLLVFKRWYGYTENTGFRSKFKKLKQELEAKRAQAASQPLVRGQTIGLTEEAVSALTHVEVFSRITSLRRLGYLQSFGEQKCLLAYINKLKDICQNPTKVTTPTQKKALKMLVDRLHRNYVQFKMVFGTEQEVDSFATELHTQLLQLDNAIRSEVSKPVVQPHSAPKEASSDTSTKAVADHSYGDHSLERLVDACEEINGFTLSLKQESSQKYISSFLRKLIELSPSYGADTKAQAFRTTLLKMRQELDNKDWGVAGVSATFLAQCRYEIAVAELLIDSFSLTRPSQITSNEMVLQLFEGIKGLLVTSKKIADSGIYDALAESKAQAALENVLLSVFNNYIIGNKAPIAKNNPRWKQGILNFLKVIAEGAQARAQQTGVVVNQDLLDQIKQATTTSSPIIASAYENIFEDLSVEAVLMLAESSVKNQNYDDLTVPEMRQRAEQLVDKLMELFVDKQLDDQKKRQTVSKCLEHFKKNLENHKNNKNISEAWLTNHRSQLNVAIAKIEMLRRSEGDKNTRLGKLFGSKQTAPVQMVPIKEPQIIGQEPKSRYANKTPEEIMLIANRTADYNGTFDLRLNSNKLLLPQLLDKLIELMETDALNTKERRKTTQRCISKLSQDFEKRKWKKEGVSKEWMASYQFKLELANARIKQKIKDEGDKSGWSNPFSLAKNKTTSASPASSSIDDSANRMRKITNIFRRADKSFVKTDTQSVTSSDSKESRSSRFLTGVKRRLSFGKKKDLAFSPLSLVIPATDSTKIPEQANVNFGNRRSTSAETLTTQAEVHSPFER